MILCFLTRRVNIKILNLLQGSVKPAEESRGGETISFPSTSFIVLGAECVPLDGALALMEK